MNITLNLIDILLISLAVQGIVLSCILLFYSRKIGSNKWLAGFIFVIAESTIAMELFASDLIREYPMLAACIPVLKMLLGPLIYFYTRSLVYGNQKLTIRSCLHGLPVLLDMRPQFILLLYESGILSIPVITNLYLKDGVQNFIFRYNIIFDLPIFFSLLIYTGISFKITSNALKEIDLDVYRLSDLNWLRTLLYLVFGLTAILFISIIFDALSHWNNYYLYLPAILFVYWLGMRLILRQQRMTPQDVTAYNKAPVKINFIATDAENYHRKLLALMEADKVYLNPALKVDILAAYLGISERLLSNLLNQHINKSFNDFVNEYRVKASMEKLADPSSHRFTIAAIAYECGFNSLATFQRCFKQYTGITPSTYQHARLSVAGLQNDIVKS